MEGSLARVNKNIKKKRPGKGVHHVSAIKSLPNDLLLEVIAKVASSSFDDLCRIRQSCKEFNKACQDDYIFRCVSMDKFELIPFKRRRKFYKKYSDFFRRCKECGNAEALYRHGIIGLFDLKQSSESGFESLKKAASIGHVEARYIYGVLLSCLGCDEAKQQGLQSLSSLDDKDISTSRERFMTCFSGGMWVNKLMVDTMLTYNARDKRCNQCGRLQDNFATKQGWDDLYDESDNLNGCHSCKMNREVNIFCDRLRSCT